MPSRPPATRASQRLRSPVRFLGAAGVLPDRSGHVLLVHHTYGARNWELPGGEGEPGESMADTVVREMKEETGLGVRATRLTGLYYEPSQDAHHAVFRCELVDTDSTPTASSPEVSDASFWPRDSWPRPISDFTLMRLEDALHEPPQPVPIRFVGPRHYLR
jgi:8-oxo-dGTP diphosphatase